MAAGVRGKGMWQGLLGGSVRKAYSWAVFSRGQDLDREGGAGTHAPQGNILSVTVDTTWVWLFSVDQWVAGLEAQVGRGCWGWVPGQVCCQLSKHWETQVLSDFTQKACTYKLNHLAHPCQVHEQEPKERAAAVPSFTLGLSTQA